MDVERRKLIQKLSEQNLVSLRKGWWRRGGWWFISFRLPSWAYPLVFVDSWSKGIHPIKLSAPRQTSSFHINLHWCFWIYYSTFSYLDLLFHTLILPILPSIYSNNINHAHTSGPVSQVLFIPWNLKKIDFSQNRISIP